MSKQLAVAARARELLGNVEPLLIDLEDTLRRKAAYKGMRGIDAYYAQLYSSDIDLLRVEAPSSPRLDRMVRRVSQEYPAWSRCSVVHLDRIADVGFPSLVGALCSHPDGYVRERGLRWLCGDGIARHAGTIVLRCLDPVPVVREVAADAIEALLRTDPSALERSGYAVLKGGRASRLHPDLAAHAAQVQATDQYVSRRDRDR